MEKEEKYYREINDLPVTDHPELGEGDYEIIKMFKDYNADIEAQLGEKMYTEKEAEGLLVEFVGFLYQDSDFTPSDKLMVKTFLKKRK